MKKSDILEKLQNLVNLLEDDVDYEHMEFTIEVRDCEKYQEFSYKQDDDDVY